MEVNFPIVQCTTTIALIFQAVPKNMPVSVHTSTTGHAEIASAFAGVYTALPDASQMNHEDILQ